MNDVYVFCIINPDDDSIKDMISAHGSEQKAIDAERFWRNYGDGRNFPYGALNTDIRKVDFEI